MMVTVLVPVELDRESEAGIPVSTWMDDTAIRTAVMLCSTAFIFTMNAASFTVPGSNS
jgi:hypothetical protein